MNTTINEVENDLEGQFFGPEKEITEIKEFGNDDVIDNNDFFIGGMSESSIILTKEGLELDEVIPGYRVEQVQTWAEALLGKKMRENCLLAERLYEKAVRKALLGQKFEDALMNMLKLKLMGFTAQTMEEVEFLAQNLHKFSLKEGLFNLLQIEKNVTSEEMEVILTDDFYQKLLARCGREVERFLDVLIKVPTRLYARNIAGDKKAGKKVWTSCVQICSKFGLDAERLKAPLKEFIMPEGMKTLQILKNISPRAGLNNLKWGTDNLYTGLFWRHARMMLQLENLEESKEVMLKSDRKASAQRLKKVLNYLRIKYVKEGKSPVSLKRGIFFKNLKKQNEILEKIEDELKLAFKGVNKGFFRISYGYEVRNCMNKLENLKSKLDSFDESMFDSLKAVKFGGKAPNKNEKATLEALKSMSFEKFQRLVNSFISGEAVKLSYQEQGVIKVLVECISPIMYSPNKLAPVKTELAEGEERTKIWAKTPKWKTSLKKQIKALKKSSLQTDLAKEYHLHCRKDISFKVKKLEAMLKLPITNHKLNVEKKTVGLDLKPVEYRDWVPGDKTWLTKEMVEPGVFLVEYPFQKDGELRVAVYYATMNDPWSLKNNQNDPWEDSSESSLCLVDRLPSDLIDYLR